MVGDMNIDTKQLRDVFDRILCYIEKEGNRHIDLTTDYYWHIPKASLYDPYKQPEPETLTLGQLTFDWDSLTRILDRRDEPTEYALIWLAAIIRAIGDQLLP